VSNKVVISAIGWALCIAWDVRMPHTRTEGCAAHPSRYSSRRMPTFHPSLFWNCSL
jgi:hypothetical protein